MSNLTHLREMQREVWAIADQSGFHDGDRSRAKVLALIHSEVSEALEADRADDDENYAEELADIMIRVMDHAEAENIDLLDEIQTKNAENRKREYKHGKDY